jgi:hydrogenase nickel incorporation protein HypA/HybF
MHELSIAHSIVSTVCDAVPADATVEVVRVRIGTMSGVMATPLEFSWDVATQGTRLDGARLDIETVPVTVYCLDCDEVVQPDAGVRCPKCEMPSIHLRSGKELEVTSVDLAEATLT